MTKMRVFNVRSARLFAAGTLLALAGCSSEGAEPAERGDRLDSVEVIAGNPSCSSLGLGDFELKIEPPASGTYSLGAFGSVTVTVHSHGVYFDWSATVGIDAVIVKGGPNANVYEYDPEAMAGENLHAPINPNTDQPYGLSHISFCYDIELQVTKDAETSLKRKYFWTLDKSADQTELLLAVGQIFAVNYAVVANVSHSEDSDWAVEGTITILNPAPVSATITGVSDEITGGIAASVDCGVTFPYVLAAGATLECSYEAALPDGTDRTNTATVTTSGAVDGGSGSAAVDFSSATIEEIDECADVVDSLAGELGTACVGDLPESFEYSWDIGPYADCGTSHKVENTATLVTEDTETEVTDDWTVDVTIADCVQGCSLTPGYWKTHSAKGPAPADDTWEMLPDAEDTIFFLSGMSWHHVLWTAPKGNAYYILAHAYIAAVLNDLNGADVSSIQSELDAAKALFETYTPDQIAALKGGNPLRQQLLALAATLDSFNNGLIGPGHCSE
jgi:hypothetical protein